MKKSKKLGLQSLALVLMSLILVAGVAFGMTGAWFQDADSASNSITMGAPVVITLADKEGALSSTNKFEFVRNARTYDDGSEYAMPGDTYTVAGGLKVANEAATSAMYLFVKVTVAGEGSTFDSLAAQFSPVILDSTNVVAVTTGLNENIGAWKVYKVAALTEAKDLVQILAEDATITLDGASLDNGVAGDSLEVTVNVAAIQQANINIAEFDADKIAAITAYTPAP